MSDASFFTTPLMSDDPATATNQYTMDRWAKYLRESIWPVGIMRLSALKAPAQDWLFCQGQAVLRAQYPRLFAAIGIAFGAGDGTTTFNLPDLRDRFPIGVGTRVLGNVFGSSNVPVIAHTHGIPVRQNNIANHTHQGAVPGSVAEAANPDNGPGAASSTASAGISGAGLNLNIPPSVALNYEIRAV